MRRGVTTLACLLLVLTPACTRREPAAADVVRGSGLRFLPVDTAGVAVIEVARIEDRAALARWLGEASRGLFGGTVPVSLGALLESDLMEQVDRVAVALVPEAGTPPGWAALVEGRFDPKTLSAGDGVVPLVSLSSGLEIAVTALPGGGVVIGPSAIVGRIRAGASRPKEGLASAPVMSYLSTVSPGADAWGAIDYAPLAEMTAGALRGAGNGLLPSPRSSGALRGVAFEGRLAAEVGFTLVGVSEAEPGAKNLADGARGIIALARMGASQGKDTTWLDFLDGLSIEQAGTQVRVRGKASRSMLQALAARVTAPSGPPAPAVDAAPSGAAARALPVTPAPAPDAARPD
jgi:hypothetical protein